MPMLPTGKALTKGFTLFELLVVLVIIGLVSAFVGPRFAGSLGSLNANTACRKIAASLRYARSRAAAEKMTYLCSIDIAKNSLNVTALQEESDENSRNTLLFHLPQGTRIEKPVDNNQDVFDILFYPGGSSSGGKIIIADDKGKKYTIHVDFITGNVHVE